MKVVDERDHIEYRQTHGFLDRVRIRRQIDAFEENRFDLRMPGKQLLRGSDRLGRHGLEVEFAALIAHRRRERGLTLHA